MLADEPELHPFRSENMAVAQHMFGALWDFSAAGTQSFASFFQVQFMQFDKAFDLLAWFMPKEKWPAPLPAEFLVQYRPAGLLLIGTALVTFFMPNTNQVFANFEPVFGMSRQDLAQRFSLSSLNWKVAFFLSGAFFLSILQLTKVSPFLYYQF